MSDYDSFLTQQKLRCMMGDRVYHTFPITIDILLRIFQSFQPRNVFHACMRAAFLVAFFSFLRISNLVPYTLSEVHSSASFFLRCRDITFTATGAYLHVFKTKTIQFKQKILEIPLPVIPLLHFVSGNCPHNLFHFGSCVFQFSGFLSTTRFWFHTCLSPAFQFVSQALRFVYWRGSLAFFIVQFQKRGCHLRLQLRSSHRVYQGSRRLKK